MILVFGWALLKIEHKFDDHIYNKDNNINRLQLKSRFVFRILITLKDHRNEVNHRECDLKHHVNLIIKNVEFPNIIILFLNLSRSSFILRINAFSVKHLATDVVLLTHKLFLWLDTSTLRQYLLTITFLLWKHPFVWNRFSSNGVILSNPVGNVNRLLLLVIGLSNSWLAVYYLIDAYLFFSCLALSEFWVNLSALYNYGLISVLHIK